MIHKTKWAVIGLGLLALSMVSLACLYTKHDIHITLDIRHIQDQAASIEDVVSGEKKLEELEKKDGAMMPNPFGYHLARLVDFSGAAYADSTGTQAREITPGMRRAIENRQKRFDEIRRFKTRGAIGETELALVAQRPADLGDEEQKKVRELVDGENADRMAIYREIARQNNAATPEGLLKIQRAWSEVNRGKAQTGDWHQAPSEPAAHQRFVESDLGRKLKEKPQPGAWFQIP